MNGSNNNDDFSDSEEESLVTRLLLRIHAANLPRQGILKQPDSYAVVTSVRGRASRSGPYYNDAETIPAESVVNTLVWFQTEVVHKNSHPQWQTTYEIDYEYGTECYFHIDIQRNTSDNDKDHSMGCATCEVGDILGSRNRTKSKRLPKGGVVFCRLEFVNEKNKNQIVHFQFQASLSKRKSSKFAKLKGPPDTIIQISKRHLNAHRQAWVTVYRSSPIKESFEPRWDAGQLNLELLCNGELDRPLRLRVMLHRKTGRKDVLIGECETSLRGILNSQRDTKLGEFPLSKTMEKAKQVGSIGIKMAQIIDLVSEQEVMIDKFRVRYSLSEDSRMSEENPYAIDIAALPAPVQAPATFKNYVNDGLLLDFMVAIDFTSSNGDPRTPGTLHDQASGTLNDYEESIVGIGAALGKYSEKFTVWGFGAKFGGVTRHLFQLGDEETVHGGVNGILEVYKNIFQSDLIMSGPTCFDQVIQAAAVRANKYKQVGTKDRYCVLLILTDGIAQEVDETKRKLEVYGSVPLSVIFVGIGRSGFNVMYDLTNQAGCHRKNSTFVEFRLHQHDPTSLGLAALKDVPNQLVEYMSQENIEPNI